MNKENNKIIAEFMGMKLINKNEPDGILNYTIKSHDFNIVQHLSFHKDWNWLMEVVEKIYQTDFYYDEYIDYNCSMFSDGKITLSTRIDLVYNQCVEFIKYYNEQNK